MEGQGATGQGGRRRGDLSGRRRASFRPAVCLLSLPCGNLTRSAGGGRVRQAARHLPRSLSHPVTLSVSPAEFDKLLDIFNIELTDGETKVVFDHFGGEDGGIRYNPFVRTVVAQGAIHPLGGERVCTNACVDVCVPALCLLPSCLFFFSRLPLRIPVSGAMPASSLCSLGAVVARQGCDLTRELAGVAGSGLGGKTP